MNLLIISFLLFFQISYSQEIANTQNNFDNRSEEINNRPQIKLDFPVVDIPFNSNQSFINYFSMRQSLALSNDYYTAIHYLIAGERKSSTTLQKFGVAAFDIFSFYVPPGNGWLHEEWHRSVLSNKGIGSFNDMNTLPFGKSTIAVSHVEDIDLVKLKSESPADQVRLSSAGMESQIYQNLTLEKDHFFNDLKTADQTLFWFNSFNVYFYLSTCSSSDSDSSTNTQNKNDGIDIKKRDFTGLDCNAWVYDLFRPDEPYTQRGVHPSGIGINRYIRFSDLSEKEKNFLISQKNYSLLNFADPFLIGKERFTASLFGKEIQWNLKLAHYLTSFGGTIDSILFIKTSENNFVFTLHNGMTDTRYLPGVSVDWINQPLPLNNFTVDLSSTLWQQPRGQRVEEANLETIFDLSSQLNYHANKNFEYYIGLDAKTPGWIAGNVSLNRSLSLWAGFRSGVF